MEVGQQGADDAEVKSGIDKDVSLAGLRDDAAVGRLARGVFQSANGCGAHSDNAALGVAGVLDSLRSFVRDGVPLAVNPVLLDHLDADGLESAESDVQCDFRSLDAASADAGENLGSEVQPCCRCGDRTERPSIDGLVLLAV